MVCFARRREELEQQHRKETAHSTQHTDNNRAKVSHKEYTTSGGSVMGHTTATTKNNKTHTHTHTTRLEDGTNEGQSECQQEKKKREREREREGGEGREGVPLSSD